MPLDKLIHSSRTLRGRSYLSSFMRNMGLSESNHHNIDIDSERAKYLALTTEEKRKFYKCGDSYVTLDQIVTWPQYCLNNNLPKRSFNEREAKFNFNQNLNSKVSIWIGDITKLEIDCIVNAANSDLRGGSGVDGAIHRAAGPLLMEECQKIGGCPTGTAVITAGYNLPAKYCIHTVGPIGEKPELLASAYYSSLELAIENKCRTIAFPCISTGVYGYPNKKAADVVLKETRLFLEEHASEIERIIFCLFMVIDIKCYEDLMPYYFPLKDQQSPKRAKFFEEAPTLAAKAKITNSMTECTIIEQETFDKNSNQIIKTLIAEIVSYVETQFGVPMIKQLESIESPLKATDLDDIQSPTSASSLDDILIQTQHDKYGDIQSPLNAKSLLDIQSPLCACDLNDITPPLHASDLEDIQSPVMAPAPTLLASETLNIHATHKS